MPKPNYGKGLKPPELNNSFEITFAYKLTSFTSFCFETNHGEELKPDNKSIKLSMKNLVITCKKPA